MSALGEMVLVMFSSINKVDSPNLDMLPVPFGLRGLSCDNLIELKLELMT